MTQYRGLTKAERERLSYLKARRERVTIVFKHVLKNINFEIVSIMRHVPPRKVRRPQAQRPRLAKPAQPSLF